MRKKKVKNQVKILKRQAVIQNNLVLVMKRVKKRRNSKKNQKNNKINKIKKEMILKINFSSQEHSGLVLMIYGSRLLSNTPAFALLIRKYFMKLSVSYFKFYLKKTHRKQFRLEQVIKMERNHNKDQLLRLIMKVKTKKVIKMVMLVQKYQQRLNNKTKSKGFLSRTKVKFLKLLIP